MKRTSKKGFTIVELLTVMGVIAVLIGLLVPALALVKEHASRLQQRAQFHGIDVGLEIYKNEFGSYPESDDNFVTGKEAVNYCGANKLAEAMVGWDLLGFHPKSGYRSDGTNDLNNDGTPSLIYNPQAGFTEGSYIETPNENLQNREVFVDMENANAFRLVDIYSNIGGFNANLNEGGFVLCDVYAKKRLAGKKAGMPILYYKARPGKQFQDSTEDNDVPPDGDPYNDDIYNYFDNDAIVALNDPDNGTGINDHPLYQTTVMASALEFDDLIVNQQVFEATDDGSGLTGVKRPYRAESYILISAGEDGLYGTGDDIFNFEKDITE